MNVTLLVQVWGNPGRGEGGGLGLETRQSRSWTSEGEMSRFPAAIQQEAGGRLMLTPAAVGQLSSACARCLTVLSIFLRFQPLMTSVIGTGKSSHAADPSEALLPP